MKLNDLSFHEKNQLSYLHVKMIQTSYYTTVRLLRRPYLRILFLRVRAALRNAKEVSKFTPVFVLTSYSKANRIHIVEYVLLYSYILLYWITTTHGYLLGNNQTCENFIWNENKELSFGIMCHSKLLSFLK